MVWPERDSIVKIESLKYDGSLNRRWETNTVLFVDTYRVIGMNDQTLMTNRHGQQTYTSKPALFYFDCRLWFNIIYIFDGSKGYYYCNISSPFQYQEGTIQYIDYDIDFIVQQDLRYEVVDIDEYEMNRNKYHYPKEIQQQITLAVDELKKKIGQQAIPFQSKLLNKWRKQFMNK